MIEDMSEIFSDDKYEVNTPNPEVRSVVQEGGLDELPRYLEEEELSSNKVFIVTDKHVAEHYGESINQQLDEADIDSRLLEPVEAGEKSKSSKNLLGFWEQLSESKATRNDTIISLGGGVVTDLGGLVASTFHRGMNLVNIPTSLLAMVDASEGGKTALDFLTKNEVGTFYHPRLVVADPTVLKTLPVEHYQEGFGEIIKYAVLDGEFLEELVGNEEQKGIANKILKYSPENAALMGGIIARCLEQKSESIKYDPIDVRAEGRILQNYGHTLAHGLEAASDYEGLPHGQAIAIGMNFAAQYSARIGIGDPSLISKQNRLFYKFKLPTYYKIDKKGQDLDKAIDEIVEHTTKDKKVENQNEIKMVLPKRAGEMVVKNVAKEEFAENVSEFIKLHRLRSQRELKAEQRALEELAAVENEAVEKNQ